MRHAARVTERATVIDVPGLEWSAGAPEPRVVMSELFVGIAFYASDARPGEEVATAAFVRCTSFRMGFPNDEALHGHRLWGRGLESYRAHEVSDSAWLAELRAVEAAHPQAPAVPFAGARHFVLTFHDSTVEAIAEAIEVGPSYRTMGEAIEALVTKL